jgi:hypothetical protein
VLLLFEQREGIVGGRVRLADEDGGFCGGPKRAGVSAGIFWMRHPAHIAVAAFGEKFHEMRRVRPGRAGVGDADGVETERFSVGAEGVFGKHALLLAELAARR